MLNEVKYLLVVMPRRQFFKVTIGPVFLWYPKVIVCIIRILCVPVCVCVYMCVNVYMCILICL